MMLDCNATPLHAALLAPKHWFEHTKPQNIEFFHLAMLPMFQHQGLTSHTNDAKPKTVAASTSETIEILWCPL